LGTLLDLELDALPAGEAVEVQRRLEAVAMEEVLLLALAMKPNPRSGTTRLTEPVAMMTP
jgi:hypothetical protein